MVTILKHNLTIRKWIKSKDGSGIKYRLTKEANIVWYATVFKVDGKWTFAYGKRIQHGDVSREYYSYANIQKWKGLQTAKQKAMDEISLKMIS